MQCYKCGSVMRDRRVTVTVPIKQGTLHILGVPAYVCDHCAEQVFDFAVVKRLEAMRDEQEQRLARLGSTRGQAAGL